MSVEFFQVPFKRNQDIVRVHEDWIAVVDGWSDEMFIKNDQVGQQVAEFVISHFPREYMSTKRAQAAAEHVDRELLKKFPEHAACVGVFLFIGKKIDIVSVGTINTFLWDGKKWVKPGEIGNYFLPYPTYASGSQTFFGRGELKDHPFYRIIADSLTVPRATPILVATDGLDDVLNVDEIPKPDSNLHPWLKREIASRGTQKDDISVLLYS